LYLFNVLDSQYQRRHADFLRQKQRQSGALLGAGGGGGGGGGGINAHDSQLSRLRHLNGLGGVGVGGAGGNGNGVLVPGGIMLTEYNPNYEFGGGTCSLQDLREIPRENLRLVKYVYIARWRNWSLINSAQRRIVFSHFREN
jgi:hypothetical protein